jgi:coenzyme F420-0:L-glutamate ligase/coenzyme F420-1:gamma-L-glutamate ligase
VKQIRAFGLEGLPEIDEGDDLAVLVAEAAGRAEGLEDGDVVVVAQKVVSKAEGRVTELATVEPSRFAEGISGGRDPRQTEVILGESARIVRLRPPLVIAETRHGFVCASAGVDASNAPASGTVVLLPEDPDASAQRLRDRLRELTGRTVAVLVTDSFGRAWRQGTTDVAIGAAGIVTLRDYRGARDRSGYVLQSTQIAIADEIAGAANLARGKLDGVPVAIVRGLDVGGDGSASGLVLPPERSLFP